ncbi:hypothetical protein [Streptomyces inhibens]|uniref:hypothetical protein n=1 Tax=Streptomyces inhibens TaxID=2293571 RepID=UPI001EE72E8E|nr:hypothetical protein [Streptomyces inhibens]UKY48031.1 hypothetical protein KI385_03880 [Streptomyces inhibens]
MDGITNSASIACHPEGGSGSFTAKVAAVAKVTGTTRWDDHNKSIADGERTVIQPLDPTPTIAEATAKVKRPKSLHVQHDMFADFLTPGWVWQSHPKGCGGAGTPAVKCTIDYKSFTVQQI